MKGIYWFIVVVLVGLFVIAISGCVNYEYTDPSGAKFKANTFLKDINADKISVSAMDEKGNGKTFDISKYQSDVTALAIQAYNMGVQMGKREGAGK